MSKCLSNLRDLLGDALLVDRQTVAFNRDQPYHLDTEHFATGLSAPLTPATHTSYQNALTLYRGDFLEGFYVRDAPDFEQWVLVQRAHYREAVMQGLHTLAHWHEQQGDLSQSITHTRRLLTLEPWREEAHRHLMLRLARNGQRAAALAQFESCQRILEEELAVTPDAETLAVLSALRAGDFDQIYPGAVNRSPEQLATSSSPRPVTNNLPLPPTPLIGRVSELAELGELINQPQCRLITITGPGGIGKTRLALQVAHQWIADKAEECWVINLAPIRKAVLVLPAIAQTLGVTTPPHQSVLITLQHYLQSRQLLLLLDNFEQVIEAAPALSKLLAAAPSLKLLVTSRAVLHLAGEYEFSVPPLALPAPGADADLTALAACASVQLLLERTQANGTVLTLTLATAQDIAQICRRLEGLPLALELAAARSKLFTPHELLTRLDQRLQLLTGGGRDQPQRQQTLRLTLDWSYHLLQPAEQLLFSRLSVFSGGFTLAAVEAVCQHPDEPALDVIAGVTALLDQSLLRPMAEMTGERRFMMLETIRDYAREKLIERREEASLCQQHAAYFLRFAEQARQQLFSAQQQMWFQRLSLEQSNFRAALSWWRANDQYTEVTQIGAALCWFWGRHGELPTEVLWLEWALTEINRQRDTVPIVVRAKALFAVADCTLELGDTARARLLYEEYLTLEPQLDAFMDTYYVLGGLEQILNWEGDFHRAKAFLERRLALSRQHAFATGIADALMELGYLVLLQGDCEKASRLLEESLTLRRAIGSKTGIAGTLGTLSLVRREQGNFQEAQLLLAEALELSYTLDDKAAIGWLVSELGVLAQLQQDYTQASAHLLSALALSQELGSQLGIAVALSELGNLALVQGDPEQAYVHHSESVIISQQIDNKLILIWGIEGLACVAASFGQATQAAHWLGAAEAQRQVIGVVRSLDERAIYEQAIALAHTTLGDSLFDAAMAKGSAAAWEDVVTEALNHFHTDINWVK